MIRSLVALFLFPAVVLADAELRYDDATTIHVRSGQALVVSGDTEVLYRKDRDELTFIEHGARRYMVFDQKMQSMMQQQGAQMQAQMAQMEAQMKQQLANVPPEQRAMVENMMRQRFSSPAAGGGTQTLRKGEKMTVGRWSCQKVTVVQGGAVEQELCVARPEVIGLSKPDYETLLSAMSAMQAMAKRSTGGAPGMVADLRQVGGVPVQSKDPRRGRVTRLKSVSGAPQGAKRFAIPPGYAREQPFR